MRAGPGLRLVPVVTSVPEDDIANGRQGRDPDAIPARDVVDPETVRAAVPIEEASDPLKTLGSANSVAVSQTIAKLGFGAAGVASARR